MLILSRKNGERVVVRIGEEVLGEIVVMGVGDGRVRLGFDFEDHVVINRKEIENEIDDD